MEETCGTELTVLDAGACVNATARSTLLEQKIHFRRMR